MARIVVEILVGVGLAAGLAGAVTLGSACSSSSSGAGAGAEDAGSEASVELVEAGLPWCLINENVTTIGQVDECSRSVQTCLSGQSAAASCPTANLAGCCKGTASSEGGAETEVCIYDDDYLAAEGGAQSWCTCKPPTSGCFGGTWQTSP
jgi:hypothetical protein